ncbi:hypothetical protein BN3590_04590 [Clostridium sp. C105KSO15]|nr:hypothetical protein BN3590_04590 [Clostridium sp. C105KSO15]
MEHSKLENHKFKKGKFITPWNDLLGDIGVMKNWALERLPEYVWIGLIFEAYTRKRGMEKCYEIITKLHELNPEINAPTISNILFMDDTKQEQFWDYVSGIVEVKVLAPLTVIYTYRQHKTFNKIFRSNEAYNIKVSKICDVLKKGFDGHSFFATDIRFVVLYFDLLQGRLHAPSHILEIICEYPHIEHDDERMRLVRPTIRSMEMFTLDMGNADKRNLEFFWERISEMSECENFYIEYNNMVEYPENYLNFLQEIFEYLATTFISTAPLNEKYLVILGISTYAYKRIKELVEHDLYNEISGRGIIRNIIEDYIMIKYLILHEKDHQNIWNEYQYYGIGLYKLIMTRERSTPSTYEDGHVNYKYLELLVNEYMDEEYINMDTSYFAKQGIRISAKEVGEEELYKLFYDYDSSFEHGLWGAVRESALLKCDSPAHQYHCVPDYLGKQKLPSVWKDCIRTMNKILRVVDEYISIPKELLEEVQKFE